MSMARLGAYLGRLSLRNRFLIAPLLGLAVLGLLTTAFIFESQRQSTLLTRVADRDLAAFDRYLNVFAKVSDQHTALYSLLLQAKQLDEGTLYDRAKERLEGIYAAIREIEKASAELAGTDTAQAAVLRPLHGSLLARTQDYRRAAASAVEMATVDLNLAASRLAVTSDRFVAMSRAFADMLDAQRNRIHSEIADRVQQSRVSGTVIAVAGVLLAILLLVLSLTLSRLLSRTLEAQVQALTELGRQAGGTAIVGGVHEIDKIGRAIESFRDTLLRLREHENALSLANEQLEERVRARTRELSQANASLRLFEEVVRSTGEAVAIAAPDKTIVEVNPAYERITGHARAEAIGTRLYPEGAEEDTGEAYYELWRHVETDGHWTGEILDRRKNGDSFPAWTMVNAVRDEHGNVLHYVSVARDITALKQSERDLKKLAFYDPLTGLPNRALFNDRLNVALAAAQRHQTGVAVMYVDLDRFKYVNDTLGHPAGDRLLVEISLRISHCLRTSDTVARMGGDEFNVLLTDFAADADVTLVAQRIIEAVSKPVRIGEETVYVGASIGISFFPRDGANADAIQKLADMALYEAKEAGRGQYCVFAPEMLSRAGNRVSLSVEIDAALNNDKFALHYQPIVDAATGRPDGVEALIRWQKPNGEWIPPEKFIPHAEEVGLIKRIDCWVLERACSDAMRWHRDGRPMRVCVNLSAISIQQGDMAKQIREILQRTGLPPHLLNLEMTETAVISSPMVAHAVLEEIVGLGVALSMDDFGTGYSSLTYLTRFPISCIKLDQSFIARIGKDQASEDVISSLLELARKLKLNVVAEGVEDPGQQAFLKKFGCGLVQGFHIGHPMPVEQLRAWMAASGAAVSAANNSLKPA
jgi:diguanylate cyclase (GGDEF)-like protein/PAS domain S-box-containing protein